MESTTNNANSNHFKENRHIDYFKNVVEPLLANGCEDKLCEWLKKNGLIAKQLLCNNEDCNKEPMKWSKARVIDRYNWICVKCKKKLPIRHETFLADLKCDFSSIFSTIDGWCSHKLLTEYPENKTYRVAVGKRIYSMCSSAAETYMKTHPELGLLGGKTADGEDAVVIVDVFPDGSMTMKPQNNNNYTRKVLCIADTSHIPARVWTQLLDSNYETEPNKIIEVVTAHVKPNSTVVTSHILYPIIKNMQGYSEVINIKTLMTFDPAQHEKSLKNIETIWSTTVETCQQIQNLSLNSAEQSLWELHWRQIFGLEAYRYILQHLVQHCNNSQHTGVVPTQNLTSWFDEA